MLTNIKYIHFNTPNYLDIRSHGKQLRGHVKLYERAAFICENSYRFASVITKSVMHLR